MTAQSTHAKMAAAASTKLTVTSAFANSHLPVPIVKKNWIRVLPTNAATVQDVCRARITWILAAYATWVTPEDCASKMWMNAKFRHRAGMEPLARILMGRTSAFVHVDMKDGSAR